MPKNRAILFIIATKINRDPDVQRQKGEGGQKRGVGGGYGEDAGVCLGAGQGGGEGGQGGDWREVGEVGQIDCL